MRSECFRFGGGIWLNFLEVGVEFLKHFSTAREVSLRFPCTLIRVITLPLDLIERLAIFDGFVFDLFYLILSHSKKIS